jgi:hypothetical protein
MSLARAMARKRKKAMNVGTEKGCKGGMRILYDVKQSYVKQLRIDEDYRADVIANMWLIYRYTMHKRYGFGKQRLIRFRDKAWSEFESIVAGNVNVREIEQFLRSEINLSCALSSKDPYADHYKQIEDRAIREVSAAVLMALIDEFGFGSRRLETVCHYAFEVSDKIERLEITYKQIRDEMEKVMER